MRAPPPEMFNLGFGTEIFYSFLIIVCSLMIYFGTKELYELSSYKGIKYFRQAFLFFALAYFFRSFIKFVMSYFNIIEIFKIYPRFFFGEFTLFVFMYFSSMAIFCLLYSIMYKKWDGGNKIYLFHALAAIIALIMVLFKYQIVYLALNLILLLFIILVVVLSHRESVIKGKKSKLYVIYILLLAFWILNILDILIPDFFQGFKLLIYFASSGIFLAILYKVIKKIGN